MKPTAALRTAIAVAAFIIPDERSSIFSPCVAGVVATVILGI